MTVDIVALVFPAPGKESRVQELISDLASKVEQKESDVIRYKPYKQTGDNAGTEVVVIERYKDEATLKDHMSTPYFQELGKVMEAESLTSKPLQIMMLTPLSGGFDSR